MVDVHVDFIDTHRASTPSRNNTATSCRGKKKLTIQRRRFGQRESLAIRYHTIRTNQIHAHTLGAFLSAAKSSIQRDPQLLQRYRLERVQVDAP